MVVAALALVALSALSFVSAQGFQATSNLTFRIDPGMVELPDKITWCKSQRDACTTLCDIPQVTNNCDEETLNFKCVCRGPNEPDMDNYIQSLNTFICQRLNANCLDDNTGMQAAQDNCTSTYADNCGTEDVATHAGEGLNSADSSASPTPSSTPAPSSGSEPTETPALAAPNANIQHLGNGVAAVAAGLLVFAL